MRILFIFFLLISATVAASTAPEPIRDSASFTRAMNLADNLKISQERQWLKLLHFEPAFFGGKESLIVSPIFFMAPNGKQDAQAELEADLRTIFSEDPNLDEESSFQCRFPARYDYFKTHLAGAQAHWPDRSCPSFEHWFQTLRGTSVSLVFSSYFLNNPSSTFGHTLLRINKAPSAKNGQRYELLDYGINYAANGDKSNPITYAFKGLFGGFPGTFTTLPYYYKVREYSAAESRDLWEYDLSLKPAAVDFLVKHIWELGPTYANYWYLTENCSYHMLTLLEAADPDLDLTSHEKKWVIPTDTIHSIYESPGLVTGVHFRPSIRSEMLTRIAPLSEDEKKWVAESVLQLKSLPEIKNWPQDRQRLALDAAIDDMDYTYAREVQYPDSGATKFKNVLLSARAGIEQISDPIHVPVPWMEDPQIGHGSRRWGAGYFSDSTIGNGYNFHYKFAFHDLLDPRIGFPDHAKITFFDLNMSYFQALQKLDLTQFSLFEVISMAPRTVFSRSLSWRLNIGMESMFNPACTGCRAFDITGGPGWTWTLHPLADSDFYIGAKVAVEYTADANGYISDGTLPRWLLGLGPNLTLKTTWSPHFSSLLEAWYRKDYQVSYQEYKEASLAAQWSPTNDLGLRLTASTHWFQYQESIDLYLYY